MLHKSWIGIRVAAVVLLCSAASSGASAQLGGLRRAVERRVEQKAEDKAAIGMLVEPTFDATTIEITAERLNRFMPMMEQRRADAAARRQAADDRQSLLVAIRDSASQANERGNRREFERQASRYATCRSAYRDSLETASERRQQELQQRMQANPLAAQSDPQFKRMMALGAQIADAQQRGDTAAVTRLTGQMMGIFGSAALVDSAALDRSAVPKCGARPAKNADLVKADRYEARAAEMARESSSGRNPFVGSSVGMTDAQARMFWERVQSWLNGMRREAPVTVTFTRAEYELMVSRRGELRKAFSGY
jgi:hypothetical protein